MINSNIKVFSSWVQGTLTEVLAQQTGLFNGATRGAIKLTSAKLEGDYSDETYWKALDGLVRRRNPYTSGAVTPLNLAQLTDTMVRVAAGTPPINIPPDMFVWIGKDPKEAGAVIGRQLAVTSLADMLDVAILAGKTALANQAANFYDYSGTSPYLLALGVLNSGSAKLGDAAGNLATWVLHSKPQHDLYAGSIANASQLFSFETVRVVQDGFGRTLVMTDSPSLVNIDGISSGVHTYDTLGLVPGGIMVTQGTDFLDNIETSNGDENIARTYQAEWSYLLGLKGFQWDKTSGGKAPTNSALATAGNWDKQATSHKHLPGVLVRTR